MSVFAIIAALLLEQWRPLSDRKAAFQALSSWADWLERSFDAGEAHHGRIAWGVAMVVPIAAAVVLYHALYWVSPFAAFLVNVAALYFTMGFRQFSHFFTGIQAAVRDGDMDQARELLGAWRGESATHRSREEVMRLAIEEAVAASHRHVFAVIFWFMVLVLPLGPAGAILYRLACFLDRHWRGKGDFGGFAAQAVYWLEWPVARLTAASFAVVGDFEDAVFCWRTQAGAWFDRNLGIVLAAAGGALGVKLGMPLTEIEGLQPRPDLGVGEAADAQHLDSAVGLLWRALVLWVFVLLVISLLRAF